MKTLQEHTDEELREELKRRTKERRKNQKYEITYVEFEATIDKVDNTLGYKKLPFTLWKYRLKDCSLELANGYPWNDYYNKQGCFKRDNAPQLGDRVKLRYRQTKCGAEVFCLKRAKIVEIIERK